MIDSTGRAAIEYATISVFPSGKSTARGGMITNEKGAFNVDGLSAGTYKVKIDFIGYNVKIIEPVVLGAKQNIADLGKIMISATSKSLGEVTVSAHRNMLESHIDKLVYNAENDLTSQGGTALDVFKKTPQVSVDASGNVELLGSSNVKVYVNGKPSVMFDNNLAEALMSIPASQIKSIEVVTSPGAKYDADGSGGIINIVLKDNKSEGVNGNVNLSAGALLETGSASIHARKGAFDISFSISSNDFLNSTSISSLNRNTANTQLIQNGQSKLQRNSYKPQFGLNWYINKTNILSASFKYNNYGNMNSGITSQQYTIDPNPAVQSYINANNDFRNRILDGNIDYKKKFNAEGEELGITLQSSTANNSTHFGQGEYYNDPDSLFSGTKGSNTIHDRETYVTIDYNEPIKKDVILEIGTKGSFSNINSNSSYYSLDPGTEYYYQAPSETDEFTYKRYVYAAYTALTFPLAPSYTVKAGLREEYTDNMAYFSATPGAVVPSYNTVIPSIVISHGFYNNQTLKISYSSRIQRPRYGDLNPFINATDPSSVTEGNPGLLPEKTQYGELSYYRFFEKGGSILITAFYRYTQDDEQTYVTYVPSLKIGDSVYNDVAVTTNMNVGVQQTTGINIYGTLPINKKFELRGNVNIFDKYITSDIVQGATINSINYRANLNATCQLNNDIIMEFFGNFNSARTEIQGTFPSYTTYSFAIRKMIWNKKGSIAFTTTNPFNEYVNQETNITGTGFTLESNTKLPTRSFGLVFTYKFGKIEYKEKKEEHSEQSGEEG